MSIIFDGRKFAKKIQVGLAKEVKWQKSKGITPKLVTFVDLDNKASSVYTQIKKKVAEDIGIEVEVYRINKLRGQAPLIQSIKLLNDDTSIHGIMIQLPLPLSWRKSKSTDKIIENIDKKKDVDGLRKNSPFLPATIKAIKSIMDEAGVIKTDGILVVGSKGEVGRRLVNFLSHAGYSVVGVDKNTKNLGEVTSKADVLITATGEKNLITAAMVKPHAVVIDVGYPEGDVDFNLVSKKTRFITPVPGGVGPVTVVSLMQNLVEAAGRVAK